MSVKKFNEDWDGEEKSVNVPGYGDWPNNMKDSNHGSESSDFTPDDETLDGLVEVITGLDKLLDNFDHKKLSEEDFKKVKEELESLANNWSDKA